MNSRAGPAQAFVDHMVNMSYYWYLTSWSIHGVTLPLCSLPRGTRMATNQKTSVSVAPLADRVVVKALEEAEQMRGGLYIPDTAKEKPQQGEIIAVGPGRFEKDKRVPMDVKVGDKVLYGKYTGSEVTIDGEQLLILRESDVLAVIN
jgi:chaperonin GroES